MNEDQNAGGARERGASYRNRQRTRSASGNSAPCTGAINFGHRAARRAERSGPDDAERESGSTSTTASEGSDAKRGNDGDRRLASRQSSGSRVHRVANFAKWATQVTEAAAAEAAAASSSTDRRLERLRRGAA